MPLTELLGVLGFGLALASLVWQILSRRPRLNVEIDRERSTFATVEVRRSGTSGTESETRTGLSVVVEVSNVSVRPNTVTKIEVEAPVSLEKVPDNAIFITDARVKPHPLYYRSMTEELLTHWQLPDDWRLPHHLSPGNPHEAGLSFLLAGDPLSPEDGLPIKVNVTDIYGKRYLKSVRLQHD